jgi:hypothetical protein
VTRRPSIATAVLLALCLGCQPSAKTLVSEFTVNRAKYEQILAMIPDDRPPQLSPEQEATYRRLLDELSLQQVVHGGRASEVIFMFKRTGLGSRGCYPGLTHMNEIPAPVVESIDDANPAAPTVYQHVDDGWYLLCHKP